MMLPTNTDLLSLMNAPLHSRSEGFIRNWLDCRGEQHFDNRLCILIRHLLTMSSSDHSILRLGWSDFTYLESCKDRAKNPITSYLVDLMLESIQVHDATLKFRVSHTLDFGDLTHNMAWIDVGPESDDLALDKLKPIHSSQFNSPASSSTVSSSFSHHADVAISVDIQTDHGLRIILSDALKLKRQISDTTEKAQLSLLAKLRDFVTDWAEKIKTAPVRPLLALSEATGPRANSLLFKFLCDACSLPCRLRRVKEGRRRWVYYAQVVVGSSSRLVQVDWSDWSMAPEIEKLQMQADAVDLEKAFEFVKIIGTGSFAEVWQVGLESGNRKSSRTKSVNQQYALKLVNSRLADLEEAELARACSRHPRVAGFISVFQGYQLLENRKKDKEKQQSLCLVMEIQETCLEKLLASRQAMMSWEEYLPILIDVSSAMSFMHRGDAHILHRDLKPGNILIDSRGRASVADFGVARMSPSCETNLTVEAGTADYMAPEQRTVEYDRPADVFSFGIVLARILRMDGWAGLSTGGEVHAPIDADREVFDLCKKCLDMNPLLRPSFNAIQDILISLLVTRVTGLTSKKRRV